MKNTNSFKLTLRGLSLEKKILKLQLAAITTATNIQAKKCTWLNFI